MNYIIILFAVIIGLPLLVIVILASLHWVKDYTKAIIYLWKELIN